MEIIHALGSLGEFVGAIAVVLTLVYLAIQVRHGSALLAASNAAMEENTRLARAAAMDRHNDAVSRWRGRLIENEEVALLWQKAVRGDDLDDLTRIRLDNLLIDWINTYRSNFRRAKAVGDEGLARQTVMSVVPHIVGSTVVREFWDNGRAMNELAAVDFVNAVEEEIAAHAARA